MYDYDDYDDDRMHFGLVDRKDWVWEGISWEVGLVHREAELWENTMLRLGWMGR